MKKIIFSVCFSTPPTDMQTECILYCLFAGFFFTKVTSKSVYFYRPSPEYLLSFLNGASTHPGHSLLFPNMCVCPYLGSYPFQTCIPASQLFWGPGKARHPTMHFNSAAAAMAGRVDFRVRMLKCVLQKFPNRREKAHTAQSVLGSTHREKELICHTLLAGSTNYDSHPQNMSTLLEVGSSSRATSCWRHSCSHPPLKPSVQSMPLE